MTAVPSALAVMRPSGLTSTAAGLLLDQKTGTSPGVTLKAMQLSSPAIIDISSVEKLMKGLLLQESPATAARTQARKRICHFLNTGQRY